MSSAPWYLAFASLGVLRPVTNSQGKPRKNQKRQTTNLLKAEAKAAVAENRNLSFKLDLNVPTKLQQTHVESLFKWQRGIKNLSANPKGFLACRGLDRSLKPEDIGIKRCDFWEEMGSNIGSNPPHPVQYIYLQLVLSCMVHKCR